MKAWIDMPPVFADRVMAHLGAPHRLRHGLHRTNALLLDADRLCSPHWLRPLRWAILYRYAVFDPLASRAANAEASAELWEEHFPALHETVRNVSGAWGVEVATAIRAAGRCFARGDLKPWQHALLDLDLGDFVGPAGVTQAHRLLARAEFAEAGGAPERWVAARAAFLAEALACPRLFHSVHTEHERWVRTVIAQELTALRLETTADEAVER